MGADKPLMRPAKVCPEIHGSSGLGQKSGEEFPTIPTPTRLDRKGSTLVDTVLVVVVPTCLIILVVYLAIIHMYDVISKHEDGSVVLVATACLTNVALLLSVFPEITKKLKEIVLMGGALGIGNTGPVSEFNIQVEILI